MRSIPWFRSLVAGLAAVLSLAAQSAPATPLPAFDGARAMKHVLALTDLGKRPAASASNRKAADYLKAQFESCGYQVAEQRFPMLAFDDQQTKLTLPASQTAIDSAAAFLYSPPGHLSAEVVAVPDRGLAADFDRVQLRGKIALVQRGGIFLREKASRAAQAGAVAVLIYNSRPEAFLGTLVRRAPIPALALSGRDGQALLGAIKQGPVTARLDSETVLESGEGINVVAVRPGTGPGMVVFGAHYDSVTNSPGANDNASGVAVTLELARVLATSRRPETLVFIAFDGEEEGLLGSTAYVQQLSPAQRKAIRFMLDFDELGAGDEPFVFDGDAALAGKALKAAKKLGLEAEVEKEFSGGSDHEPFADAGVPVLLFYRPDSRNHSPQDAPNRIKAGLLETAGEVALELLAP